MIKEKRETDVADEEFMSRQNRINHAIFSLLPTEVEGFDSLAELALDMRWHSVAVACTPAVLLLLAIASGYNSSSRLAGATHRRPRYITQCLWNEAQS